MSYGDQPSQLQMRHI